MHKMKRLCFLEKSALFRIQELVLSIVWHWYFDKTGIICWIVLSKLVRGNSQNGRIYREMSPSLSNAFVMCLNNKKLSLFEIFMMT